MWTFQQSTGKLYHNGVGVALGYSGLENGKNNPDMQQVHDVGPIPQGFWKITGPPATTADHGPYVLRLVPEPETQLFGRAGFLIHGDSIEHPGHASMGCVILPRPVRQSIWLSGDHRLQVIA